MKRVPDRAATTVALRGALALVVLTVGLLCLFGRASQPHAAPADEVSVSRTASSLSSPAVEDTAPCGKKTVMSASSTQRSDAAASHLVETLGVAGERHGHPAPRSGLSLPGGPAPPPPVNFSSVLRM
ncbi:hypothetical protein ACWEF9_24835 [Streptomyces sp. NPDC004980]